MRPGEREQHRRHEPAARGRRPRRAEHAERRETERAEYPDIVQTGVEDIRYDDRRNHGRRAVMRLQRLTKHHECVQRPDRGNQPVQVARRHGNDLGRLAYEREDWLHREKQQRGRHCEHNRQHETALQSSRHSQRILGPERLRDDRVEREQHAHAEDRERRKKRNDRAPRRRAPRPTHCRPRSCRRRPSASCRPE